MKTSLACALAAAALSATSLAAAPAAVAAPASTKADLAAATVAPGEEFTYKLYVNNYSSTSMKAQFSVDMPSGFEFQEGSVTGATTKDPSISSGNKLSWPTMTIAAGGSKTIKFDVKAPTKAGAYTFKVSCGSCGLADGTTSVVVKGSGSSKPEPKPAETSKPKPTDKPEPKPSETAKPEKKPSRGLDAKTGDESVDLSGLGLVGVAGTMLVSATALPRSRRS